MKKIAYYVIAVHVFLVLWSALWMPSKKVDRKPLQVRTVVHAPPVVHSPPAVVKQAVQKTAPKPQVPTPQPTVARPSPTPSKPPAPTKPSTPIKPSTPVKPSAPAKKSTQPSNTTARPVPQKNSGPVVPENLVQQLQESIAKIDQKSHKESPKEILPAPKWVPQLKIDEESGGEESLFVTTLVHCLQEALNLPEVGEVKVELTLKRDGSFVQMRVLRSESERNKKFLEEELKKLTFPPFDGNLKNEKEHAFVITFCNS